MKKVIIALVLTGLFFNSFSQKYITKAGRIDIFSETSLFTIEAVNKKTACILNTETGEIVASTLCLSFEFEEALVEEHFNENYMESETYPKATFTGKIFDMSKVDFKKNGTYNITFTGSMTMHGQTNSINEPAVVVVSDTGIKVTSTFDISLAAYKIKVEESYKDRINDEIELKLNFDLAAYATK
jgi:hypothetical protein